MSCVSYLLSRVAGPFFSGVFAAAATSVDALILTAVLLVVAAIFAFLSSPAIERRLDLLFSELDELTAWHAE